MVVYLGEASGTDNVCLPDADADLFAPLPVAYHNMCAQLSMLVMHENDPLLAYSLA